MLDFVGHHRKEFRFDLEAARPDRRRLAAARARDRARASRSCRPAARSSWTGRPRVGAREHPLPGREPLAADGRRASRVRRPGPADLPRRVRRRAGRHPAPRQSLLDAAAARRRPARRGLRLRGQAAQARPRLRPRRRPAPSRRPIDACSADDAPAYDDLSPAEQRLARMLFFSLWPDGGGHASYDDGLAALRASEPLATELSAVVDLLVRRGSPP